MSLDAAITIFVVLSLALIAGLIFVMRAGYDVGEAARRLIGRGRRCPACDGTGLQPPEHGYAPVCPRCSGTGARR